MRIQERKALPRVELTPEEVLVAHPLATRVWFCDSRRRSKRALRMTPKQIMELCRWYTVGDRLFCVSKVTSKVLEWDGAKATWSRTSKGF